MTRPIPFIELVKTFVQAFLVWLVVMGIWPMNEVQQTVTLALLMAGVNLVGAYFESKQTTPLADPRAIDGEPLVRVENPTRSPSDRMGVKKDERTTYRGPAT